MAVGVYVEPYRTVTPVGAGRGEADGLGALGDGQGLLHLGCGGPVGVPGLVGVEGAGPGPGEADHAAPMIEQMLELDESTVMVTASPEVAVAVGV